MDFFELVDRIQDVLTLIGVPVAIYLLIKIYLRVKRL